MKTALVMTVIGPDRPGLVELVAGLVASHGGNWLESRMSHLGGQFAGILRVQVPLEKEQELIRALRSLQSQGLSITAQSDQAPVPVNKASAELEIVGQDRPGIVRQISRALAIHGVNVEELDTECTSAPMSGETLFKARALLHIPESCNLSDLRAELERIAQDLLVDVSLQKLQAKAAGGTPSQLR